MKKLRKSMAIIMSFMIFIYSVPSLSLTNTDVVEHESKIELTDDALKEVYGAGGNIVAKVHDWVGGTELIRVTMENQTGLPDISYVVTAYGTSGQYLETVREGSGVMPVYTALLITPKLNWGMVRVEVSSGNRVIASDSAYSKGVFGGNVKDIGVYVSEWHDAQRQANVTVTNYSSFTFTYSIYGTDRYGNITETFATDVNQFEGADIVTVNSVNPETTVIVANGKVAYLELIAGSSSAKRF